MWENITSKTGACGFEVYRLQTVGGWLVRTEYGSESGNGIAISEALVFVPDPDYKWTV